MKIYLKPFGLKLLYFLAGSPALILLALLSQKDLESKPENFLLFGLFGGVFVAGIMVQKKLWETGLMKTSKIETLAALVLVTAAVLSLISQIVW